MRAPAFYSAACVSFVVLVGLCCQCSPTALFASSAVFHRNCFWSVVSQWGFLVTVDVDCNMLFVGGQLKALVFAFLAVDHWLQSFVPGIFFFITHYLSCSRWIILSTLSTLVDLSSSIFNISLSSNKASYMSAKTNRNSFKEANRVANPL